MGEAWRSIDRSLLEAGVPRPGSLSPAAYGRRLTEAMERYANADRWSDLGASGGPSAASVDRVRSLVVDVATVADLLARSVFGGEPVGAGMVRHHGHSYRKGPCWGVQRAGQGRAHPPG